MCALPVEFFLGQFGGVIGAVGFAVVFAFLALGGGIRRGHGRLQEGVVGGLCAVWVRLVGNCTLWGVF